jgi:multidrug transporter EmrE-like cation transporter
MWSSTARLTGLTQPNRLNVLTHVPLSKAFPITAVAYIAIELMGWTIFKEPVMPLQIMAAL